LTRFKELWKSEKFSDDARSYWREEFVSKRTQADLRGELLRKLKIHFRRDDQLTAFRSWLDDQDRRDKQAERMVENERRIRADHPDWTLDQVRDEVLKQSYFETLAAGNFKLGLATIREDVRVKKISIEHRKLVLLEKKAAAYDRAQEVLSHAKASGGITPETMRKIESELKLL